MDGHEITELNLSSLERTMRIDAEFYKKEHIAVLKNLYGCFCTTPEPLAQK